MAPQVAYRLQRLPRLAFSSTNETTNATSGALAALVVIPWELGAAPLQNGPGGGGHRCPEASSRSYLEKPAASHIWAARCISQVAAVTQIEGCEA